MSTKNKNCKLLRSYFIIMGHGSLAVTHDPLTYFHLWYTQTLQLTAPKLPNEEDYACFNILNFCTRGAIPQLKLHKKIKWVLVLLPRNSLIILSPLKH